MNLRNVSKISGQSVHVCLNDHMYQVCNIPSLCEDSTGHLDSDMDICIRPIVLHHWSMIEDWSVYSGPGLCIVDQVCVECTRSVYRCTMSVYNAPGLCIMYQVYNEMISGQR